MAKYPYKPGDNWNHSESNESMEHVRRTRAQQPLSVSEDTVNVIPHQNFEPYSVFGVGSEDANTYDEPQAFKTNDPNSESVGPYYTNGVDAMMADVITRSYPIRATPSLIALEGAVSPGERAKPTDTGKAMQDERGELLCVGDTRDGRAHFVYSPLPQPDSDCIAVRAPEGGLLPGVTDDLEIFNQAGQTDAETLSVENIWSTRVGDNPERILFVGKVRGIGAADTYKPKAAECNEEMP